jgi:MAF protein
MVFPLILASNSPRRKELLGLTGWPYEVKPAGVDESIRGGEPPASYVRRLAQAKAEKAARNSGGRTVLAADTTVAHGAAILGKPGTAAAAIAMLTALRAKTHQVYTAIALYDRRSGALDVELCTSQVPMRAYTPAEMLAYVNSGDPLDKAGGYAIQHAGFHPVENFSGCFASVMGLPLCHLARAARRLGIEPKMDIAQTCQAHLQYACPVHAAVLAGEDAG